MGKQDAAEDDAALVEAAMAFVRSNAAQALIDSGAFVGLAQTLLDCARKKMDISELPWDDLDKLFAWQARDGQPVLASEDTARKRVDEDPKNRRLLVVEAHPID